MGKYPLGVAFSARAKEGCTCKPTVEQEKAYNLQSHIHIQYTLSQICESIYRWLVPVGKLVIDQGLVTMCEVAVISFKK